jgi:hypothetical protein
LTDRLLPEYSTRGFDCGAEWRDPGRCRWGVVCANHQRLAPVTGTYLVLVGTFDSGFDATGTYSLVAGGSVP